MKQFWKFTLATVTGCVLSFIVIFGIIFIFFSVLISGLGKGFKTDKDVLIKEGTVLEINLENEIPDKTSDNPFKSIDFVNFESTRIIGLNDILKNIEKAKNDDNVKGIYLNLSVLPAGFATIEEIRNKLIDFKESEKFIISYSDVYSQKAYYLASVSDEIYLNPQGSFLWSGLVARLLFFKNALEKLGIEPQIFRYGEFKAATEPFTEEKMSEANRLQTTEMLQSIWDEIILNISEERNISIEDLNLYADELMCYNAETSLKNGMIDGIMYYDEFLEIIKEKTGADEDAETKDFIVNLTKYQRVKTKGIETTRSKNKVAVVFAEGEIVMGKGREGSIGGDRLAEVIREIRLNDDYKAIVLRVNSPGGSGLASETIWREVVLTVKEKPVVVSMGNLAASGGYYIACPANYIFAQPNTITGSIGVFGLIPNMEELMNDKLGISIDVVATNKNADIGSVMRPIEEHERQFIQKQVDDFYEVFLDRVADGRKNLSTEEIRLISEGRIWSGISSVELGLVDEIGGINDAVNKAIELAELDDYRLIEYPKGRDFMEKIISDLSFSLTHKIFKQTLGENYKTFQLIEQIKEMDGVQARMIFDMDIK